MVLNESDSLRVSLRNYNFFLTKVLKDENFSYRVTKADLSSFSKFYDELKKRRILIDEEWLLNYIEYGLNKFYLKRDEIKFGMRGVRFNWVFGLKTLESYFEHDNAEGSFFQKVRAIVQENNLSFNYITEEESKRDAKMVLDLDKEEENEKSIFFGDDTQIELFAWCLANTSLYNPNSSFCNKCANSVRCKKILKQRYFNLYKMRCEFEKK